MKSRIIILIIAMAAFSSLAKAEISTRSLESAKSLLGQDPGDGHRRKFRVWPFHRRNKAAKKREHKVRPHHSDKKDKSRISTEK